MSRLKGWCAMLRLCVFSLLSLLLFSTAHAITLVKDGLPAATIVVSATAFAAEPYNRAGWGPAWKVGTSAEREHAAAADLQTYLEKISGARLPLVSETARAPGPVILVGESTLTKPLPLIYLRGVTKDFREEGYTIYCKGDTLALVGNDAGPYHGTEYAVYEFLHRLGARWYMPGEYGEYLPALKTVTFADMNFTDAPDFVQRTWWQNAPPEMWAQDCEFKIRNKANPGQVLSVAGDGSIEQWLPDKEYVTAKPEYFARQIDGSINETLANLTHPDVPAMVAEKMKAEIRRQLEQGITIPQVAIAPADGIPIDYTRETMAGNLGFTGLTGRQNVPTEVSISEEWFRFVNKIAELVTKEYPQALIATNGYANRDLPPEGVPLHPNLCIEYANIMADSIHAIDNPRSFLATMKGDIMRRWCRLNPNVYLYDYEETMMVSALTPVPGTRKLAANMPLMKEMGLAGFLDENRLSYMEEGIPTKYLRARMMWDAGLNVKEVLDDYYDHWYGAAAKPARAFWDSLEECMEKTPLLGHEDRILPFVYSPRLIAELERQLTKTEKLADDERSKTHVRADRLILEHLKGYLAMHEAEFAGKYTEAARLADEMMARRVELEKLSPFYCVATTGNPVLDGGGAEGYWGLAKRKEFYLKVAGKMNGETGALVAMAPRQVKFSLDPQDLGRFQRWHEPRYNRSEWQLLDTCKPFYLQAPGALAANGYPYQGNMWYVFELPVPADAKGKSVRLFSPIVVTDAWVWVNGEFAGHRGHIDAYMRPAPMDIDVTAQIRPGVNNVIAVRVTTGFAAPSAADGFTGRVFLYSPVEP